MDKITKAGIIIRILQKILLKKEKTDQHQKLWSK